MNKPRGGEVLAWWHDWPEEIVDRVAAAGLMVLDLRGKRGLAFVADKAMARTTSAQGRGNVHHWYTVPADPRCPADLQLGPGELGEQGRATQLDREHFRVWPEQTMYVRQALPLEFAANTGAGALLIAVVKIEPGVIFRVVHYIPPTQEAAAAGEILPGEPEVQDRAAAIDRQWFRLRPGETQYIREALPGEFGGELTARGTLMVQVTKISATARTREPVYVAITPADLPDRAESTGP